ncbi:PaaI family thioesterase [Photobacterium sanctipauli]|uniref:PaaI family thioesterase n=1 Tax=Photobacterium sanctipauli TaxID=1342794 RepID=A0A2T3NIM9_9GAMM|nr:PaaI family thioesterase [Photobacterium sanctipauli]
MSARQQSFQRQIKGNHCYGCGSENPDGLNIQSYWALSINGELLEESLCHFEPEPHHSAAPTHFLNGGIIATVIDCHCICTAMAYAYQRAGRPIGQGEGLWFATGALSLKYHRPVGMDSTIILKAHVIDFSESKAELECQLFSNSKMAVSAKLTAVRVPDEWMRTPG